MADDYIKRSDVLALQQPLYLPQTECIMQVYSISPQDVAKIPSADVQEVRHGEWKHHIFDNDLWANYCSECGAYLPYGMDWQPNFCPDCGADMRGNK